MTKLVLKSLAIGVMTASLFTACSQSNQPQQEAVYVDPEFQGAPSWVMNPMVEGAISDIGSAPKNAANDFGFQRDEAVANARDNIAKQLQVKVSNLFKSFKSSTGSGKDGTFDKSVESVSKQITSQTLSGSKMIKQWRSRTGTMYVQVVLDSSIVKNQMEKSIKTSFKNDKALYQKFLAAKANKELDKELEKFNQ